MPRGIWKCILLKVLVLDSLFIFLVADWTAALAWLTPHTPHLHTFHSNLFDTFKHPSASHFSSTICLIFFFFFPVPIFITNFGKRVDCPLTTRQTLFQFTYSRGCRTQKLQPRRRISSPNAPKHLWVNSIC